MPSRSSKRKAKIQHNEQLMLMSDFFNSQAARFARLDATNAEINERVEERLAAESAGAAAPMDVDEGGRASTEGGGPPTVTGLPALSAPPGPLMADAEVKKCVDKLLAFCKECDYKIIGEQHLTDQLTIVDGRVVANLKVLGFPVNELLAMLNPSGTGLCASMQPFAVMLGALGDLDETAPLVIIDIHPKAAHWKAGQLKLLDEGLIAKVNAARLTSLCALLALTLT